MPKLDFGNALAGGITGAGTGSMFGPIGTGVGGLVGAAAGLFGKKKKKKPKIVSTLDPKQQELYDQHIAGIQGQGPFAGLYNFDADAANTNFDQNVARKAYRGFQENIIPGITGQFRKDNTFNSSYTGEALSRAGRDVQEGLDALRSDFVYRGEQDALNRRADATNSVLNMQTQAYSPRQQTASPIDQILGSLGPDAANWLKDYLKSSAGR